MLKYKICVLFLFIIGICTFSFISANAEESLLKGKMIYLDAGHGYIGNSK